MEEKTVIDAVELQKGPVEGTISRYTSPVDGPIRSGDEALKVLGEHVDISDVDMLKLRRKIDWVILPLMFSIYALQYLDKR